MLCLGVSSGHCAICVRAVLASKTAVDFSAQVTYAGLNVGTLRCVLRCAPLCLVGVSLRSPAGSLPFTPPCAPHRCLLRAHARVVLSRSLLVRSHSPLHCFVILSGKLSWRMATASAMLSVAASGKSVLAQLKDDDSD